MKISFSAGCVSHIRLKTEYLLRNNSYIVVTIRKVAKNKNISPLYV